MARDLERRKATRHAYYLAHKEDFKRRNHEYWARNRERLVKSAKRYPDRRHARVEQMAGA